MCTTRILISSEDFCPPCRGRTKQRCPSFVAPRPGCVPCVLFISQVQILSHQSKIATQIELFVGHGDSYESAHFRRLGYLSLNSNERSKYQARELKSVYVNAPGQYLRMLVHKCYINEVNLFNQVRKRQRPSFQYLVLSYPYLGWCAALRGDFRTMFASLLGAAAVVHLIPFRSASIRSSGRNRRRESPWRQAWEASARGAGCPPCTLWCRSANAWGIPPRTQRERGDAKTQPHRVERSELRHEL